MLVSLMSMVVVSMLVVLVLVLSVDVRVVVFAVAFIACCFLVVIYFLCKAPCSGTRDFGDTLLGICVTHFCSELVNAV